jgi:hypothetical protein
VQSSNKMHPSDQTSDFLLYPRASERTSGARYPGDPRAPLVVFNRTVSPSEAIP